MNAGGLEPGERHRVTDMDTSANTEMPGQDLMQTGVLITIAEQPNAALVMCTKSEALLCKKRRDVSSKVQSRVLILGGIH